MKVLRKIDHRVTVGLYLRGLSSRDLALVHLLISVNIKGCVSMDHHWLEAFKSGVVILQGSQ